MGASVDWVKFKSKQEVKAVLRHDCKDTREATKEHSNVHLNPELTATNTGKWDTYQEAVDRFDDRLAKFPPKRKDAVLGVGFSIPAPEGLPEDQEDAWFDRVRELMAVRFGEDNIACFAVHRDEKHEYVNPETKERVMSRTHAQGILVPVSGGRLCAKEVTARAQMIGINREIQDMTASEFGLEWMDGSGKKNPDEVDQLKVKSLEAEKELLLEEITEAEKRVSGITAPLKAIARTMKTDDEKRAERAEKRLQKAKEATAEALEAKQLMEQEAEKARQEAEKARKARQEDEDKAKVLKGRIEALTGQEEVLTGAVADLQAEWTRLQTPPRVGDMSSAVGKRLQQTDPERYQQIVEEVMQQREAALKSKAGEIQHNRGLSHGDRER